VSRSGEGRLSRSKAGEVMDEKSTWTVDTVKEHVVAIMDERDKRYEQRFEAQQKAVDTALEVVSQTRSDSFSRTLAICGGVGVILEIINFAFFAHR
jgi:hypothetical protein